MPRPSLTDPPLSLDDLTLEERVSFLNFLDSKGQRSRLDDPAAVADLLLHWRLFHHPDDSR